MERLTERIENCPDPKEIYGVWVKDHDYVAAANRLAAYEDTGLTPGDIKVLLDMAVSKTDKVLQLKEELHAMKNELCQYCAKYKHAHEGACDECRWRKKCDGCCKVFAGKKAHVFEWRFVPYPCDGRRDGGHRRPGSSCQKCRAMVCRTPPQDKAGFVFGTISKCKNKRKRDIIYLPDFCGQKRDNKISVYMFNKLF